MNVARHAHDFTISADKHLLVSGKWRDARPKYVLNKFDTSRLGTGSDYKGIKFFFARWSSPKLILVIFLTEASSPSIILKH